MLHLLDGMVGAEREEGLLQQAEGEVGSITMWPRVASGGCTNQPHSHGGPLGTARGLVVPA